MTEECCRLCSGSAPALINIFGDEGIKRNISEKINSRLQIFVNKEDILPKTICFCCYGKLDIFDTFVKSVHSTQTKLTKQASELTKISIIKCKSRVIDTAEINDRSIITKKCSEILGDAPHFISNTSSSRVKPSDDPRLPLSQKNAESTNPKVACLLSEVDCDANERKPDTSDSTKFFSNISKEIMLVKNVNCDLVGMNVNERTNSRSNRNTKFKRKYFELKPKDQRVSNTPTRKLSRVISKTHSSLSNPGQHLSKKVKTLNEQNVEKKDFSTQAGNTLYSDLKTLKNSLLVRKIPVKNAETITKRILHKGNNTSFFSSKNDRGCQTQVLLGVRSKGNDGANVHQKSPYWDAKSSKYTTETIISPLNI